MRSAFVALALLLAVVASSAEVAKLTADTFAGHLDANEHVLVEFFAPWCGHCKALAPEYDAAAKQLAEEGKTGVLASVDCTVEKELCSKYEVKGFPTLKFFTKGVDTPSDYEDARKKDALVKFVKKMSLPPFQVLSTQAEVDAFLADDDSIEVVGYFADDTTPIAVAFKAAANLLRNDFDVAISKVAPAVADHAEKIVLYKNFDEKVVVFPANIQTPADMHKFASSESLPSFGEIGPENFQKYVDTGLPLFWVFADYNDASNKAALDAAESVAASYKGKIAFVKLDGVRWADHGKNFGLTSTTPGMVIEDRTSRKNYLYTSAEHTGDAVKAFADDFVNGKLVAHVKSQEVPATNDEPVKVVVGKTFDTMVMDETKDVFVEFYAPWCGHCKALAPKYDQLAKDVATFPNVVIAKLDSTENDAPVEVEGFPTLYFFPANDKKNPVKYNGDRSVDAMKAFVVKHASTITAEQKAALTSEEPEEEDGEGEDEMNKDEL